MIDPTDPVNVAYLEGQQLLEKQAAELRALIEKASAARAFVLANALGEVLSMIEHHIPMIAD
jgi:hypothetical protein